MARIRFNFESESPTFIPPSSRRGALDSFSDTKSGLKITVGQGRSSFDIVSNVRQQRKIPSFGQRSLAPFARQKNTTPFTVSFSKKVYSVSVEMGDYGEDNDLLSLQAFSSKDGSGQLVASSTGTLIASGKKFSSRVLTVTSQTPIRLIKMIGGTSSLANSVFYDNLTVDTSPSSGVVDDNTPATTRDIGVLSSTFVSQDVVGASDGVDYYKFQLNEISALDFRVTGSTGSAPNSFLFFDANKNGTLDSFEEGILDYIPAGNQQVLFPGTYFVRISSNYDEYKYTLSLTATPTPSNLPSDPGFDPASAFDITPLLSSGSFTAKDAVGVYDQYDYYKFTITQPRNFTSTAINSPYSAQIGIGLLDNRDGTYSSGISSYYVANLGPEYPPRRLLPGTYYVSVQTALDAHTRYEFTLNLS